jgi:hypothetical protein
MLLDTDTYCMTAAHRHLLVSSTLLSSRYAPDARIPSRGDPVGNPHPFELGSFPIRGEPTLKYHLSEPTEDVSFTSKRRGGITNPPCRTVCQEQMPIGQVANCLFFASRCAVMGAWSLDLWTRSIFHVHTPPRSFNKIFPYSSFARVYLCCNLLRTLIPVPQKYPTFQHSYSDLINGLNPVICGENLARFRPFDGTVDEVNQNRDDLINIADQLSGRVAFPIKATKAVVEATTTHALAASFHMGEA